MPYRPAPEPHCGLAGWHNSIANKLLKVRQTAALFELVWGLPSFDRPRRNCGCSTSWCLVPANWVLLNRSRMYGSFG